MKESLEMSCDYVKRLLDKQDKEKPGAGTGLSLEDGAFAYSMMENATSGCGESKDSLPQSLWVLPE